MGKDLLQYMRSIIDACPVPMAVNDSKQNIVLLNRKFCETFGYTRQDIPTLSDWWPRAYPDEAYRQWVADAWGQHLQRARQSGADFDPLEVEICCLDGLKRTVMATAADLGDDFAGMHLVILYDLTEHARTLLDLYESRNLLQTVINSLPVRVFWKDRDLRYLGCNELFARDAGKGAVQDVVGKCDTDMGWREQAEVYRADDRSVMSSGRGKLNFEEPQTTPDGQQIWLRTSKVPLKGTAGDIIGLLGIYQDITDERAAAEQLQLADMVYRHSSEAIAVTDANGAIVAVNPAFTEVTGYEASEVLGKNPRMLGSGRQDAAFYKELWAYLNRTGMWQGEIWNRRKNGEIYAEWLTINTIFDAQGQPYRRVALFTDITQRKESEALIWRQANFDPLTGLPNRRMFYDRLEQEVRKAHRLVQPLALIFLDLDRFKEVNDSLGHDMGDLLLQEAARRLQSCVRESDTVARLGGDEFTVILGGLEDIGAVERICGDILQKLSQPFRLEDELAYVSASLGVTLYPEDAETPDGLVKNADQAMYAAKHAGRNRYSYFTPSMQAAALQRQRLISDLHMALDKQEFRLYYQPIIDLAGGAVYKAEALIRWQHPKRGLIGPAEFIAVAEETGLILAIGEWVFETSVAQVAYWRDTLHPHFQISINKSPVQFHDATRPASHWPRRLEELGLPGDVLAVEITEGVLLSASGVGGEKLLAFRDYGMQAAVDDFGTGYSALSYLKRFDIDYLKIDQSFVRGLAEGSEDQVLCEAMIVMAHKLGLKVVAEGVETREQESLLKAMGCDYAQGYLYTPPLPAGEFEAWHRTWM